MYIRESFFHAGSSSLTTTPTPACSRCLDHDAKVRTHGTLKERPAGRFERERRVGKTHPAISLAIATAESGRRVYKKIDGQLEARGRFRITPLR